MDEKQDVSEETIMQAVESEEAKPSWVEAAEAVVPQDTKRKIVSNAEFIEAWNRSEYLSDAAAIMGIEPASARARANKLRTVFAKAEVELKLKVHPRKPRMRSSLVNNANELARLAKIANDTYEEKETDQSQE